MAEDDWEEEYRPDVTWEDIASGSTQRFTMWLANLIRNAMLGDSPAMKAHVTVLGSKHRGFVIVDGFVLKYYAGEELKRDGSTVFSIVLRYEPPGEEFAYVFTIEVPVDQVPR